MSTNTTNNINSDTVEIIHFIYTKLNTNPASDSSNQKQVFVEYNLNRDVEDIDTFKLNLLSMLLSFENNLGFTPEFNPYLYDLCSSSGSNSDYLSTLFNSSTSNNNSNSLHYVTLRPKLLGGKGGFGSMLKKQGSRMASLKRINNDACRDLNGRRIRTVKLAQKLEDHLKDVDKLNTQKKQETINKINSILNNNNNTNSISKDEIAQNKELFKKNEHVSSHIQTSLLNVLKTNEITSGSNKSNNIQAPKDHKFDNNKIKSFEEESSSDSEG